MAMEQSIDSFILENPRRNFETPDCTEMKKHKLTWIGILILALIVLSIYYTSRMYQKDEAFMGALRPHNSRPAPNQPRVNSGDPVADFIAAYQTPIEFYGKVVDQHGDVVAGAAVKILPFDNAFRDTDTMMMLESDKDGKFSVKDIKGLGIGVQVEKDGYLTLSDFGFHKPASSRNVDFGRTADGGASFKNPSKPTLFTLHKLGPIEYMLYLEGANWKLPVDGCIRKIALDSKDGIGTHQIEFRYTSAWSQLPDDNDINFKRFDWKLEASIPGGGFFKCLDDYSFEAPESGYQERIGIDYPASMPIDQWKKVAHGRYFVKFPDGTHGRIKFSIAGNDDRAPLNFTSWLSLKPGSRNLASPQRDYSGFPED